MALLLLGCPADDDGSAGTEGDTDGSTGTPTSSSTSPTSAASTSSTDASSSSSTTDIADTSSSDSGEGPTTSDDSSSGSSGSTGRPDACAGLDREACNADATCTAILCGAYEETAQAGTPWCLGEAMFIGCRSADLECGMEPTVTCEGDDAPIYRCREDCIPEGFDVCDPPVNSDVPSCER